LPASIANIEAGDLKVDDELHLTPLAAEEEEPELVKLRAALDHRIGEAQLPDLLLQVDAQVSFQLDHARSRTTFRQRAADGVRGHPGSRHLDVGG